ncbi:sigma-70 family RNA polymerase sigma factor [Streptomyces lasalocidi]
MGAHHDEKFEQFTRAHWQQLRQAAYLLCADWQLAEDLTQTALIRCYPRWRTLRRQQAAFPYVRRALVRCFIDHTRKHSSREQLPGELPDAAAEEGQALEERDALTRALAALAPMQRATLVLRFWHDLDVAETARLLRRKPATVRSDTARGLERMRTLLAGQEAPH